MSGSKKISTFALILLITGAIDSIRNLPTTALFGAQLIPFFLLAAIFFLIPVSLIAAELSSTFVDEEGGIFHWVDMAFGENAACIAIWLQWINTLVWFPTILSFISGTIAHLLSPKLANSPLFLVGMNISLFWTLTLVNLKGLKTSANFASFCAIIGMILPMTLIIGLALYWLGSGHPIALNLSFNAIVPDISHTHSFVSLTAMVASFLGMELASVHVKQVKDPKRNFPIAVVISALLILSTMIFGSLAIAIVIPKTDIHLVDGVMQAFQFFFGAFHLTILIKPLALLIIIGSIGGMTNWIISPTKGLFLSATHGFLPTCFKKTNKQNVASPLLIMQAICVSLISLLFLLFPHINQVYWFLTDLSTELYMLMYLFMFFAAIRLRKKALWKKGFHIPGGAFGFYLITLLGLIGVSVTLVIGFIAPSDSLILSHKELYPIAFGIGVVLLLAPAYVLIRYKASSH